MHKIIRTTEDGTRYVFEVRSNVYLALDDAADYQRRDILPGSTWTVEPATLEDIADAMYGDPDSSPEAIQAARADADALRALVAQRKAAQA